jgi:hypothetical protein
MGGEYSADLIGRKRSVITNILLAVATVVSIMFLIFALMQKTNADHLQIELDATQQALEECQKLDAGYSPGTAELIAPITP